MELTKKIGAVLEEKIKIPPPLSRRGGGVGEALPET